MTTHVRSRIFAAAALFPLVLPAFAAGDPEKGESIYRVCAGCHSIEPGRHRAGPSLAQIFGRRAGTVEGFMRYSKALKQSNIVWDERTLDTWIKEPDELIPRNLMAFPGIPDAAKREHLVAFLKEVSARNKPEDPQMQAR